MEMLECPEHYLCIYWLENHCEVAEWIPWGCLHIHTHWSVMVDQQTTPRTTPAPGAHIRVSVQAMPPITSSLYMYDPAKPDTLTTSSVFYCYLLHPHPLMTLRYLQSSGMFWHILLCHSGTERPLACRSAPSPHAGGTRCTAYREHAMTMEVGTDLSTGENPDFKWLSVTPMGKPVHNNIKHPQWFFFFWEHCITLPSAPWLYCLFLAV